jgi:hypothetical protein
MQAGGSHRQVIGLIGQFTRQVFPAMLYPQLTIDARALDWPAIIETRVRALWDRTFNRAEPKQRYALTGL